MVKKISTHKDLIVWQNAIKFVKDIYDITKDFPKEEIYGLTSQIRRSAVSIPSNIAEGAGRKSKKEFLQYLYIAVGSLAELETQLIIAKELEYIKSDALSLRLDEIRKMLTGLIRSLKAS